jgi:ATP-binding protein involved in chromosome partitioning
MSGFICPNCGVKVDIFRSGGGKKIAEELEVPFLGSIPIDQKICEDADKGMSFIVEHADSPATKAFMEIVNKIDDFMKSEEKRRKMEVK